LEGHFDDVDNATFSPDGKKVVTTSRDQTVRIWDTESGKELHKLEEHTVPFVYAAFSPDGKQIVTHAMYAKDSNVIIWDVETGKKLHTQKLGDSVLSVAFSLDGKKIASVSDDQTVCIWDTESGSANFGKVLHQWVWGGPMAIGPGPLGPPSYVAFFSDGKRIHIGGIFSHLIRDVESGKDLQVCAVDVEGALKIFGAGEGIRLPTSTKLSPDGKRIIAEASWDQEHNFRILDTESGKEIKKMVEHAGKVSSAAFSPDGKKIITVGEHDRTVRIWDADSGAQLKRLEGHAGTDRVAIVVILAVFSPDSKKVVVSSSDGTLRIWDWERVPVLPPPRVPPAVMDF
jgi:WD40 repeat protein